MSEISQWRYRKSDCIDIIHKLNLHVKCVRHRKRLSKSVTLISKFMISYKYKYKFNTSLLKQNKLNDGQVLVGSRKTQQSERYAIKNDRAHDTHQFSSALQKTNWLCVKNQHGLQLCLYTQEVWLMSESCLTRV